MYTMKSSASKILKLNKRIMEKQLIERRRKIKFNVNVTNSRNCNCENRLLNSARSGNLCFDTCKRNVCSMYLF